jgi:hypothetical protein
VREARLLAKRRDELALGTANHNEALLNG